MTRLFEFAAVLILSMLMSSCAGITRREAVLDDKEVLGAIAAKLCQRTRFSFFYFLPSKTEVVSASFAPENLDEHARKSLLSRNRNPVNLPPLELCDGLKSINADELDSMLKISGGAGTPERWEDLYKKYSGLKGVIRLSLPGYSATRGVAVVQVAASCGWLCGNGSFWFVRKVSGRWQVDNSVPGWQS